MKKNIKILFIVTLMILNLFFYEGCYISSQAEQTENSLDLLILNKQLEDELSLQMNNLMEELDKKNNEVAYLENNDTENEVEVVKLSFVHNNVEYKEDVDSNKILKSELNEEIKYIENQIYEIDKKIQDCMIEDVRLEKIIEEEKREYLATNNLDYIEGCWPLPSYTQISSPFGERIHPITNKPSFHKGIDIPAPQYTDIVSSDDGIVIFSGEQNGYGNVVKIKHFDGKITVYAHNTSNIVVEGDVVRRGQAIAQVGSTGNSTGNHVHFETIVNDVNINPLNVVN